MKRLLLSLAMVFPLTFSWALERNLVRVPAPEKTEALLKVDFQLYHRAGDYWIGSLPVGAQIPAGGQILDKYHPQQGELFRLLLASPEEANKLSGKVSILYQDKKEMILQATHFQLETLPAIKGEWIRITLTPKPLEYSGIKRPETEEFHPLVQEFVNQVSTEQYTDNIQTLQDFVTRNTLTQGCYNAADWIFDRFDSLGLNPQLDGFLLSGRTRYNVIGELVGDLYPDSLVFIVAHYDATAGAPMVAEPIAPGADDNGSGTACVLECARILSQYSFEKTIRFIAFAGEEQGLYGSEHYVSELLSAGAHVVGCFNFDMISWSGEDPWPPDLVIYADNNPLSQVMAEKIEDAVICFMPYSVQPMVEINPSMGSSDHGPFWDAGYPAICAIEEEAWGPDFNPYYHTTDDLITYCDLAYAVNCVQAGIAAAADYAGPIVESGPALTVSDFEIEELVGNGNNIPDPGETISILVTLINLGVEPGNDISAILITNNPYLTITQNYATFPNLLPQQTGIASQAYIVDISSTCPPETWATTQLNITAAGSYQISAPINFLVSDPLYSPMGPDLYGYYAFDILDQNGPEYNWIEIDPTVGGPGTRINFTQDDQTVQVNLPFSFTYYSDDYTTVSICTNGWIAMGATTSTDHTNSIIPDPDGPPAMLAPFWEDLSPQIIGSVSYYYDSLNHYFIVEYNGVRQYLPTWALETFEVVLYDPAFYPTPTGDGKILFQYAQVSDPSSCTVGIEDTTESIGLQYLYNGTYDVHAMPLAAEMAILFTTVEELPAVIVTLTPYGIPIQIPASGGTFQFNIAVTNNELILMNFDVWTNVTLPNGNIYGPLINPVGLALNPGVSQNRDRNQFVPANAPAGQYSYNGYTGIYPNIIWDMDSFNFEKLGVNLDRGISDWLNWGEDFGNQAVALNTIIPQKFALSSAYPNPFNSATKLQYQLAEDCLVSLVIFDIRGREVVKLAEGFKPAGSYETTFNASGLPSGIYFASFKAGEFHQTQKLLLIK